MNPITEAKIVHGACVVRMQRALDRATRLAERATRLAEDAERARDEAMQWAAIAEDGARVIAAMHAAEEEKAA